jgi:hypothetical protein
MEVKKMKKTFKKRAFISAIAMLVVSAIVLTSATFAWFSMARNVEVEAMDLNITSPEGVQISANTSAWKTQVLLTELKGESEQTRYNAYAGNTNHFPELLSPASSSFRISNNLPKFYQGSIDNSGVANIQEATDANGGYVVFDLFVKVATAQNIYWKNTTVTCDAYPDTVKAMRVALVQCGTCTANQTENMPIPANAADHRAVIYEPQTDGATTRYFTRSGSGLAVTGSIVTNTQYVEVPPVALVTTNANNSNTYFTAQAGINRIRVYLWMEGNDAQCTNDVAGNTISFNLALSLDG